MVGRPKLTEDEKAARDAEREARRAGNKAQLTALQEAVRNLVEEVDLRVWRDGMSVMEAIMDFVEERGGDMQDVGSLVKRNKDLRTRLEKEARALRLLKAEAA